jgi:hypothetical protein
VVRSHSRLPFHRPISSDSPDGWNLSEHALFNDGNSLESRMLKFLGSTVGIIFLIGLVVVIVLLKAIF